MGEQAVHHADYTHFDGLKREEALKLLLESFAALADGQDNWVCNLANASSLLWHAYRSLSVNVNWAGFYVTKADNDQEMILGPFQGKVACQLIKFGSGVCGTAAHAKKTQLVPNVNEFPGHIACDGETKSEIVVPVLDAAGKCLGVIDIDCLDFNGFNEIDQKYLEQLANIIAKTCKF